MPLLDHFHPPLEERFPWESLHSNWATKLADLLNERWLPAEFVAMEHTHVGPSLEIDVATFEEPAVPGKVAGNGPTATATAPSKAWAPPVPARTLPAIFPDSFEVRIIHTSGGRKVVGAIELVSPGNKDRADERQSFAAKCVSYLRQGVSLAIIDIVTKRRANLHNETLRLMQAPADCLLPDEVTLYATAFRPVLRGERPEIDIWTVPCAVGKPLPVMPLRLTGDQFAPVDFETSYQNACRSRRIP